MSMSEPPKPFPDEIFRSLVEATTDFIGTIDRDGNLLYLNPAGRRMLEIPLDEDITGQSVLPYNEGPSKELSRAVRAALETGTINQVSIFVSRSGRRIFVSQTFIVHETSLGTQYSTIARDISAQVLAEQELRHRADHDPLTGLLNRSSFRRRILDNDAEPTTRFLTMLDLDGFKGVNDRHGHHSGDQLLTQVAGSLQKTLPADTLIARLGGDEFAVFSTTDVTNEIRAGLREVLEAYESGVSIGSIRVRSSTDIEEAFREADRMLYEDKRCRKSALSIGV
jgi:diguanylate cyclase (GGDEF)-like protein/PAS domain S-box-containing protein